MDEKNVKNLSWKDGFVSSIDGVATKGNEETQLPSRNQQLSFQSKYASPILKMPTTLPDMEANATNSTVRKLPTDSLPYECVSTSSQSYSAVGYSHETTYMESEHHYEKIVQTSMEKQSIGNKENNYSELNESGTDVSTSFEEEYNRKRQQLYMTVASRIDSMNKVNNKEKLYVLVNRNAGVITHVLRANPKHPKK